MEEAQIALDDLREEALSLETRATESLQQRSQLQGKVTVFFSNETGQRISYTRGS